MTTTSPLTSSAPPATARATTHHGPAPHLPAAGATPPATAAVVLFEVTFATAMDERDLSALARTLDLTTNVRSTARPREEDLGFARLDYSSGAFLTRNAVDGRWRFQARTWGHPAADTVHRWHVLIAEAAHLLDPTVTLPERLIPDRPAVADRFVVRASNTRLGRIRRRLVGLS